MVLLCDGRLVCGCADPYGRRVLGDARTTTIAGVWTGETASGLRRDLNAGGSKFCGDCALKLPLKKDQTAAAARPRRCGAAFAALHRDAPPPATSRASRPAAPRRPGSPAPARPACSTSSCSSASWTKPGPSLGRIDFFNYGEAFLHKRAVEMCEYIKTAVPAHLSLHEHERPGLQRGAGPPAGSLRHRRGDVLDRRRHAGELREVPAPRRFRQGDPQPGLRDGREARRRARRAVHQLALHPLQPQRQRRGDAAGARRWPPSSASIGCAGS